jgi:hypothetical protein
MRWLQDGRIGIGSGRVKGRIDADGRHLPAGAGPCPADVLGGPPGLLVCSRGGHHRTQPLGCLQPRAAGPASLPVLRERSRRRPLDRERAKELLCAFWIKFNNHPAPPKTGVTAKESNTYVDFALINVGGVKANGSDAVNDLSYLILDVIEEMRLLQPSSMVQLSKKNPDRFIRRA